MQARLNICLINQHESVTIKTNDGSILEEVGSFKYLGAWMHSTERDVKQRKAAAWRASSKLTKIWKSTLSRPLKLRLFAATAESVFLYGCEAWTITPKLAKEIDGCYTRMLRAVLNVHWKQHITNMELYGELPKLSDKIRQRRLRFAGHCSRSQQEPVSKLLHWTPNMVGESQEDQSSTTRTFSSKKLEWKAQNSGLQWRTGRSGEPW